MGLVLKIGNFLGAPYFIFLLTSFENCLRGLATGENLKGPVLRRIFLFSIFPFDKTTCFLRRKR